MTTNFSRVQNLRATNPYSFSKDMRQIGTHFTDGSTAAIITAQPRFKKGSVASQIVAYLKTRKNPATIAEIAKYLQSHGRDYSSSSSANRTISKYMLQLGNWGVVKASRGTNNTSNRSVTRFSYIKAS